LYVSDSTLCPSRQLSKSADCVFDMTSDFSSSAMGPAPADDTDTKSRGESRPSASTELLARDDVSRLVRCLVCLRLRTTTNSLKQPLIQQRHGNPPQGYQELLVVRDKAGRPPGELWGSKSMECDIFPSVL